ncbi:MAG: tol-pal system protein YbgF [Nitrospirae bacterium]|nr:tol-pal system protein YbgF [Nitrospirota bacterium]
MKTDINTLKSDSYETKKELSELNKAFSQISKDIENLLPEIEKISKEDSLSAIKESQSSLFAQVSDLLKEIQALRGKHDEDKHSAENSLKEAMKEVALLKAKLDEIDKALSTYKERLTVVEEKQKKAEKPIADPLPDEEKLYKEALDIFNEKKYNEAREKFSSFLKSFPAHRLSGNAQFWIGETYYGQKDFENAILSYEEVMKKFKDSPKVPSAMLKQAIAFIETGDIRAGAGRLKDLIEKYPDSEEAKTAQKKLKGLKTP